MFSEIEWPLRSTPTICLRSKTCKSGSLPILEDFGKRNMPDKRARRHFSQLSEIERGLIIGMKTTGWSTCRVAGQMDHPE
ncbi:hypothetical protein TNCV_1487791 [Trichonephila clavipes]|nr:hypothetical protein TNCV_1487791 [Trichonephila clavipes]